MGVHGVRRKLRGAVRKKIDNGRAISTKADIVNNGIDTTKGGEEDVKQNSGELSI